MTTTPFSTSYLTPTTGSNRPEIAAHGDRALVLGGGGAAGNAWLIGVVAGLFDAGVDLTHADLMIGTSAGSTAAAQLAGARPVQLFADVVAPVPPRPPRPAVANGGRGESPADHMRRTSEIIAAADGPVDMRRRLGAAALELAATADECEQQRWRTTVAARLPSRRWPPQAVLITAVDAQTGEPVVIDRHSGVELADAVAASCSSVLPYRIGDSRYIDGGYRRSSENADLAIGYERVLVLSPLGGRSRAPLEWGMHLAVQVDELRTGGASVETILPDDNSRTAFGGNMMDLSTRPAAALAGHAQGVARAEQLTEFWR